MSAHAETKPQNPVAMFDFRIGLNDILKYKSLMLCDSIQSLNEGIVNECKDNIEDLLKVYCKRYTFQFEQGESGYLHFQGRISLIKKHRLNEFKHMITEYGKCPLFNYLAPTVNATYYKGENFYVMKAETRLYGPWTEKQPEIYIPIHLRGKINSLMPFQTTIFHSYNPLDDRVVHLVYCPEGNKGKSTLCSLIELYEKGLIVPPFNNMRDIMTYLCDIYYEKSHTCGVLCFDLPRAMNKSQLNELFAGIEELKRGKLYDNRYRSRRWWIDSPTIWVFTNDIPNLSMLSLDRWRIYNLVDSDLVLMSKVEIDKIIKENLKLLNY